MNCDRDGAWFFCGILKNTLERICHSQPPRQQVSVSSCQVCYGSLEAVAVEEGGSVGVVETKDLSKCQDQCDGLLAIYGDPTVSCSVLFSLRDLR